MPPCSILANRKQLATGSFISRVPSSRYSSYGGCCAFLFSDRRVPVAIVNALFPISCIPAFMALRSVASWLLPGGSALYTRSGKRRSTFSVGDKSTYHPAGFARVGSVAGIQRNNDLPIANARAISCVVHRQHPLQHVTQFRIHCRVGVCGIP